MPSPSRVGTIDPADTKVRAYVDAELKEVPYGSPDAAFVFKRSVLDTIRERRKELGIGGDEALRAHEDSRKIELANAERRLAQLEAEVQTLRAATAPDKTAKAKAEA